MFNFCFSHSVSTTSYFKKRNETQRFNAILQIQHKFLRSILHFCSFLRICVGSGAFFEAISALKLRCLWWTRTFLQKNVIPECGLFVSVSFNYLQTLFLSKRRQTFFGDNFCHVFPLNLKIFAMQKKIFQGNFHFSCKKTKRVLY